MMDEMARPCFKVRQCYLFSFGWYRKDAMMTKCDVDLSGCTEYGTVESLSRVGKGNL